MLQFTLNNYVLISCDGNLILLYMILMQTAINGTSTHRIHTERHCCIYMLNGQTHVYISYVYVYIYFKCLDMYLKSIQKVKMPAAICGIISIFFVLNLFFTLVCVCSSSVTRDNNGRKTTMVERQ
jgi:hypothetical protein